MKLMQELLASKTPIDGVPIQVTEEKSDLDFSEMLDKYMDEYQLHRLEGRRGVTNLATICRAIGYKDPQYYGQLSQNASVGDLILFLEDNSGAIEGIIEFIKDHGEHSEEWKESIADMISDDEPSDENEDE